MVEMVSLICPQCHAPVSPSDQTCRNCGIDLALAAALAERQMLAATPAPSGAPYVADVVLPRFGDYLLQNGYITEAQLQEALHRREVMVAQGRQQTVGQTLLQMGVITREKLDLTSIQQIQQLQSALLESNRQLEKRVAERTQELRDALQRLTELTQLKVNFISNISHELRTPLAQIQGYSALVADGTLGELNPDQKDAMRANERAVERLERLINDLIQFAASAKGEMTVNLAPFFMQRLAPRLLGASSDKAQKGKINLNSEIPASLPPVAGDEEKIYWVLFQLLDNAIKFTPSGGQVTLEAADDGAHVALRVRDTGIGIPAERLDELFQPFHQLDGSATRRYGGTGLGLALVRRIVEAHGSAVKVESQPGRGSLFSFQLPHARD